MSENRGLKTSPELEDTAHQIGEFIEYFGFKKVHGKIWTHVFLSPTPLDAGTLIKRLGISKALVSMSLSDLLEYEVLQIVGKGPKGTTIYRANPNVTDVILNVLRQRERRMLSRISSAIKLLQDTPPDGKKVAPICDERIKSLHHMVSTAEATLDAILQMSQVDFETWQSFNNLAFSE